MHVLNSKKSMSFIKLLLLSITINAFSVQNSFFGSVLASNQKYVDLKIYGSADFTQVMVANKAEIQGSAHLVDFTCQTLEMSGSLTGELITSQIAQIYGSFDCKECAFDMLEVHGSAIARGLKIKRALTVHGFIQATDLECPYASLKSTKAEFNNSQIEHISVEKNAVERTIFNLWGLLSWEAHEEKTAEICLIASTVNSISFPADAPGKVILSRGASIAKVVHGVIEYK